MNTTVLGLLAARAWAMEHGTVETFRWVATAGRDERLDPEALQSQLGRKLEGARAVTVRDGVAVVPVTGPIFRRANLLSAISGATSTELLARDIRVAVESPDVKAVLLEIDSPGGEAMGICELAALVAGLRRRKPIHGYADGYCCSGAYWIAAACESIVASPTAVLGSIGVVVSMFRKADDEVEIVSSVSPKKRPDVSTEEGRAEVQRWVDQLAEVFVSDVARYRSVSEDRVRNEFGAGGVMVGRHAVKAGLADRVGLLEAVIPRLAAGGNPRKAAVELWAEAADWLEPEGSFFCSSVCTLKSAYDSGERAAGGLEGEMADASELEFPEGELDGAGAGVTVLDAQVGPCDEGGAGRSTQSDEPADAGNDAPDTDEESEGGRMSDAAAAAGVSEAAYAEMQERLRRAEARTAALEAVEARREVTAELTGKRFLHREGNPGYGLAAASRERLTEALMGIEPAAREAVLGALTDAQLVPVGTVGFPSPEGANGRNEAELSDADRQVIRAEAERRKLPETEVEQQFVAARRERTKRAEGGVRG